MMWLNWDWKSSDIHTGSFVLFIISVKISPKTVRIKLLLGKVLQTIMGLITKSIYMLFLFQCVSFLLSIFLFTCLFPHFDFSYCSLYLSLWNIFHKISREILIFLIYLTIKIILKLNYLKILNFLSLKDKNSQFPFSCYKHFRTFLFSKHRTYSS